MEQLLKLKEQIDSRIGRVKGATSIQKCIYLKLIKPKLESPNKSFIVTFFN